MIYDVVMDINLPGRAMQFAAGESIPHARLGDALAAMLLQEGSIVEQGPGSGVPAVEPDLVDEAAPEPEQEVEPLAEPEQEPEAVEEEDDYGR